MKGKVLPYDEFEWIMARAPWPVVDLLFVTGTRVVLFLRKQEGEDRSYDGEWSLPGMFLLKGLSFEDADDNVLEKELALAHGIDTTRLPAPTSASFVLNNTTETRGHLLHNPRIYWLTEALATELFEGKEDKIRLVALKKLPDNTILHHVTIIELYLDWRKTQTRLVAYILDKEPGIPQDKKVHLLQQLLA